MRTRTFWLSLLIGAAGIGACNSDFTSGNICGNVLFLNLAQGESGTIPVGGVVTLQAQRGVATAGPGGAVCTIRNLPSTTVQWISSDTTVLVVQTDGTAHGIAPGTAAVTASQGGQTATLMLTVTS
ncbi:MAG TPA: hypothetical protein VIC55_01955 [Gemmatimonadaceae bacterium]|jgi:hypothetical protein